MCGFPWSIQVVLILAIGGFCERVFVAAPLGSKYEHCGRDYSVPYNINALECMDNEIR